MVTVTELWRHLKRYLDAAERGEIVSVCRRGTPLALLGPIRRISMNRWRRATPLRIEGLELSKVILEERLFSE